jgi:hypothetical protein
MNIAKRNIKMNPTHLDWACDSASYKERNKVTLVVVKKKKRERKKKKSNGQIRNLLFLKHACV